MKVLVVANPVSGRGRAAKLAGALVAAIEAAGHGVTLRFTTAAGEAGRIAGEVDAGVEALFVVGGDGTLNEVLNGLQDPSRIVLAQLPTGTANILAHELRLPRRPVAAAALLEHGRRRRIDMGRASGRRFLMVASAGFDAMVVDAVARRRTGRLGYAGYPLPILAVLRRYRQPRLEVRVDDGPPVEGGLVIVSNTRNYGGLFRVADRARCDSGSLDVCVLAQATPLGLVRMAARASTGGVSGMRGLKYLTGRRIVVTSRAPVPVQVDGDPSGVTPLEIDVTPRHVPFLVPRTGD